jgi:four helix bundle protein
MENQIKFNDYFREKTVSNALQVVFLYREIKSCEEMRILGKQMIRSATSVAANTRAACRARSAAEHYSKMCIVVEECDETLFWLELIQSSKLVQSKRLQVCIDQTRTILMALARARKNLKVKQ